MDMRDLMGVFPCLCIEFAYYTENPLGQRLPTTVHLYSV